MPSVYLQQSKNMQKIYCQMPLEIVRQQPSLRLTSNNDWCDICG
jgi:hypothetical protein